MILTSFRQRVILPTTPRPRNKPLKSPPRLGLNCKLQKLIDKQIIIFCTPSNVLCTLFNRRIHTDKTHSKHHIVIGMCSLSIRFNLQYWISVNENATRLKGLSKCENVRYRKSQVFLYFAINSQSKLNKFSTLF